MYADKTLFAQLMDFLPRTTFVRIVDRYGGNHRVRTLSCAEHVRVLAFAQLTYRESPRDVQAVLSAQSAKLYHMGMRPRQEVDFRRRQRASKPAHLRRVRATTDCQAGAFLVTSVKSNADLRRVYSVPSDRAQRIVCDQTVALSGFHSYKHYPHHPRIKKFQSTSVNAVKSQI